MYVCTTNNQWGVYECLKYNPVKQLKYNSVFATFTDGYAKCFFLKYVNMWEKNQDQREHKFIEIVNKLQFAHKLSWGGYKKSSNNLCTNWENKT